MNFFSRKEPIGKKGTHRMELPERYKQKMKELLGESEAEEYFASFEQKAHPGLRTNQLKLHPEELKQRLGDCIYPVSWIPEGFYYKETESLSKHPYYYAGLYYLQEPSAMTPAFLLHAKPGERVLDLCAAPGGKSTAIGASLQGKGLLFSNDISHSRAKALLKNIELAGIPNVCVSSETPEKLAKFLPEYFDKILVDAPCSGEGMFRKEPDMISSWIERGPDAYIPIQREILCHAVHMLKPGGHLLYSTCTFDKEENEGNVRFLLEQYPELEIEELPLFPGASPGIGIKECLRLFPHHIAGEGHFMAKFHKKESSMHDSKEKPVPSVQSPAKYPAVSSSVYSEIADFFQQVSWKLEHTQIFEKQGMVYLLPEEFLYHKEIRYLRTGLFLGELKKGRFEPSQALAMALKKNEFSNTLTLSLKDERVIRYLKGETLSLTAEESAQLQKGWCLVAVDGYSLGFAKVSAVTLKNKYYPGWRWQ